MRRSEDSYTVVSAGTPGVQLLYGVSDGWKVNSAKVVLVFPGLMKLDLTTSSISGFF